MMMKTPAITNQYGEMNTGMPNGRAMMIPGPLSRRWGGFSPVSGGFSGVVLATLPMLRGARIVRVDARPAEIPPNVGGVPYGGAVDKAVLAPGGRPPGDPPLGGTDPPEPSKALSPSRAADFMT